MDDFNDLFSGISDTAWEGGDWGGYTGDTAWEGGDWGGYTGSGDAPIDNSNDTITGGALIDRSRDTVATGNASTAGNIFSRFLGGKSTGEDKALATLGFGIAALASALRNKPPEVKIPRYVPAPVYNRGLTAPMLPPQPLDKKSESGQNIYNPMVGLPLFFNPNPFQFNPTEAPKRYGPTPEEVQAGYSGYLQGLERLYQTLGPQPDIQMGSNTVTGGTGNDTVTGGAGTDTVTGASGGYLRGPGDGMSDSIETFIEGGPTRQEALLSQGEFVIPADVVSGLGNGSSEAGSQRLYQLMDSVRMARHNTKKQPPAIDIEGLLQDV